MSEKVIVHIIQEKDRANLTMRYRDPLTGRHVKRSAETPNRKTALKAAAQWESEVNEGRYQKAQTMTWSEFRSRFEDEKLSSPSVAKATRAAYSAAFNHLERVLAPDKLCSIKTETISLFVSRLRKPQQAIVREKRVTLPPMKESSIACPFVTSRPPCAGL